MTPPVAKEQWNGTRVLVLMPAFNEAAILKSILTKLKKVLTQVRKDLQIECQILLVDDGSTDNTPDIARTAGAAVISHKTNLGYGAAIRTGLQHGLDNHYDIVVQIDADGQHDPKDLPQLLLPVLKNQADITSGSRFLGENGYQVPPLRLIGIKFFSRVISFLTHQKITDVTSGYRAINRRVMELFSKTYPNRFPAVIAASYLDRRKYKFVEIPVAMNARTTGQSELTPWRLLIYPPTTFITLIKIVYFRFVKNIAKNFS